MVFQQKLSPKVIYSEVLYHLRPRSVGPEFSVDLGEMIKTLKPFQLIRDVEPSK